MMMIDCDDGGGDVDDDDQALDIVGYPDLDFSRI